ncbi:MAG: hypothetical protein AB7Q29_18260 [Vicinamibacterales bacterium]
MTLEPAVTAMAARIPRWLVTPASLAAMAAVARQLPPSMTDRAIFELALEPEGSPLDVSFFCRSGSAGVLTLADLSDSRLPRPLRDHDVWMRLRAFSAEWSRIEPGIAAHATHPAHVWLEFDHDAWQGDVPVPSVFLGFRPGALSANGSLSRILETIGRPASAAEIDLLDRCLRAPALSGRYVDLGVMFSRPGGGLRLVVHGVGDALGDALADVGLSSSAGLVSMLGTLRGVGATTNVSLDLGDRIGPAVGVEYQLTGRIGADRSGWVDLLDRLVALGCCPPASRDALLEWPGGSVVTLEDRLAPATIVRKINHIKLTWRSSLPLRAKAYLLARAF